MNHLTLMFSDMTSGHETYAAGRYIDLARTASDTTRSFQSRVSPVPLLQPHLRIPARGESPESS